MTRILVAGLAIVLAGPLVVPAMLHAIAVAMRTVDSYQSWPWNAPLAIGGFVGILFGAGWLLWVTRGPEEKPASWRYRDR